jgi:hypothetical protein
MNRTDRVLAAVALVVNALVAVLVLVVNLAI